MVGNRTVQVAGAAYTVAMCPLKVGLDALGPAVGSVLQIVGLGWLAVSSVFAGLLGRRWARPGRHPGS